MRKRLGNNGTRCNELQGAISGTNGSSIKTSKIELELDSDTAFALCNLLGEEAVKGEHMKYINREQQECLIGLGKALAAFVDHPLRDFEHLNSKG